MSNNIGDFRAVRGNITIKKKMRGREIHPSPIFLEIPLPFTLPNEQLDFESENDSESIYSVSKKKEREVEFEKVADEDNSSTRSSVAGTGGSGDDLMLSLRNRSLSSPSAMMKSP